ncbi:MAG: phosphate ABC transporter substrate-binding protein PstS [Dermatophilaceae bacterium]
MTIIRSATTAAFAMTAVLALTACGSDATSGAATAAGSGASADCPTGTLKAEGSSAQKNAIEAAIKSFQTKCTGATINYAATGSGAGIKQFLAGQVDFGGSDSALKPEEATTAKNTCGGADAWHLPMVTGPVGIAYNLPGVDKLVLNAEVAAKIFAGVVTKWNDPAIAALNAGKTLPDKAITVYFRSDESGTTDNFTKYLKAAAGSAMTFEAGKAWKGPVGEGKPQNAGVASATKAKEGSVSYLEWSYVTQNNLGMARIDTGSGPVELTAESVGKAVSTATQVGQGNDLSLKLDYATKTPGAYPIILVTYEIVCSKYKDPAKGKLVKAFLNHFASDAVQKSLVPIGYAPLPEDVDKKVAAAVAAIG